MFSEALTPQQGRASSPPCRRGSRLPGRDSRLFLEAFRMRLSGGGRAAVAASFLRALPSRALALADLLDHPGVGAGRARLADHAVPARELTFGIAAASEEQLALLAAPLQDLAFLAFGTFDPGADRLALPALCPVAVRIAGASQELAEAGAPAHHRLAALVADLVGGYDGRLARRDLALFVAGELAGVGAGRVVGAGEKLAVAAPFDNHHAAVFLALDIGRQSGALDLGNLFLRFAEPFLEAAVEAPQRLDPVFAPFLDLVEVGLELRGEADFQDIGEGLDQQIAHDPAK